MKKKTKLRVGVCGLIAAAVLTGCGRDTPQTESKPDNQGMPAPIETQDVQATIPTSKPDQKREAPRSQASPDATVGSRTKNAIPAVPQLPEAVAEEAARTFEAGMTYHIWPANKEPCEVSVFYEARVSFGAVAVNYVVNPKSQRPLPQANLESSVYGSVMTSASAAESISKSLTGRLLLPFRAHGLFSGPRKLSVIILSERHRWREERIWNDGMKS